MGYILDSFFYKSYVQRIFCPHFSSDVIAYDVKEEREVTAIVIFLPFAFCFLSNPRLGDNAIFAFHKIIFLHMFHTGSDSYVWILNSADSSLQVSIGEHLYLCRARRDTWEPMSAYTILCIFKSCGII